VIANRGHIRYIFVHVHTHRYHLSPSPCESQMNILRLCTVKFRLFCFIQETEDRRPTTEDSWSADS